MDLLKVQGLYKRYPSFTLHDVSFTLPQGKMMGMIGKNGAGKSTFLKSIVNMVCLDGGTVEMFENHFINMRRFAKTN